MNLNKCDPIETSLGNKPRRLFRKDHQKQKQKRAKCDLCEKSFTSIHASIRHVESVHDKIKKAKCDICQRPFRRQYDVTAHIKEVHLQMKRHKCVQCERSFFKKRDRDNHLAKTHLKLKPFSCDICEKPFAYKKVLDHHVLKVHPKNESTEENSVGQQPQISSHFGDKQDIENQSTEKKKVRYSLSSAVENGLKESDSANDGFRTIKETRHNFNEKDGKLKNPSNLTKAKITSENKTKLKSQKVFDRKIIRKAKSSAEDAKKLDTNAKIVKEAFFHCQPSREATRPAWAGFKTAEEGRAKICKFLWQKL
jgi:hypothetical protein